MTKQDLTVTVMILWSSWLMFMGAWAVLRFVYGLFSGEGKWKGFKHAFYTFLPILVFTVWGMSQHMGEA